MGLLTRTQLFICFSLVTAIDLAGGVTSYKDKAWIPLALACLFVPMDLGVLYIIAQYTDVDMPPPDYGVKA